MPDEPITFTDLVRGELTFTPENVPDYGILRANGARSTPWSTRSTTP